jgi:hypothetical protein
MMHIDTVVVLETMWGTPRDVAPGFFRINPENHSGRRLYKLLGERKFLVTNACKELVGGPNQHGTPDPEWLAHNLQRLTFDLLLVCGKVAQRTYLASKYKPDVITLFTPHPAARSWTNELIAYWQGVIKCSSKK